MPIDPNEYDYLNTSLIPALHTANPLESNIVDVENGISPHQDLERLLAPTPDPVTQELVQPPVAPPAFKGPSEDDKLAAARVMLGTGEESPPAMIDKVVGKTTSSSTVRSPESIQAADAIEASQAKAQAATDIQLKAAKEQQDVEAKISEEDNTVISSVETARASLQNANQYKFQQDMNDIDSKVAELANYQPETFWGSKSTADKITAALSVGLGAYGQALLGSGSNIGQVLLERNMSEFDRNQKMIYNGKIKQIEGMKGSLQLKRQLADDAEKILDATKLAGRAQVQAKNAKFLASAKTPQVQATLMQRQAGLDMEVAKIQGEIAARREEKNATISEKDIIQKIMQTPGMGKDGKPINLTEGQSKARVNYSKVAEANQVFNQLPGAEEAPELEDFLRWGDSRKSLAEMSKASYVLQPFEKLGNAIESGMGITPYDQLSKKNPDLARFYNSALTWTQGAVRHITGATISHDEAAVEYKSYFKVPGDTPKIIEDKRKQRQALSKSMREAGGL